MLSKIYIKNIKENSWEFTLMIFPFKIRIDKSFIVIKKNVHSLIRNVNSTFIHLKDQGTSNIIIYKE